MEMKPEEVFTKQEYEVSKSLFDLEVIRAGNPFNSHSPYDRCLITISGFLLDNQNVYIRRFCIGRIEDAKNFKRKFKRFEHSILKAEQIGVSIVFTLELK